MNQNEALSTLIRAAKVAYTRGAFKMEEVGAVNEAIKVFVIEEPVTEESQTTQEEISKETPSVMISEDDKSAL